MLEKVFFWLCLGQNVIFPEKWINWIFGVLTFECDRLDKVIFGVFAVLKFSPPLRLFYECNIHVSDGKKETKWEYLFTVADLKKTGFKSNPPKSIFFSRNKNLIVSVLFEKIYFKAN